MKGGEKMKRLFAEKIGGVGSYLTILGIVAAISIGFLIFTIKTFISGNWQLGIGLVGAMIVGPILVRLILVFVDFLIEKTFNNNRTKNK